MSRFSYCRLFKTIRFVILNVSILATLSQPMCRSGYAASLKDVAISPEPPADETEDPGFPAPGENPNPIDFFDAYSWRMFIALNWPAKGGLRGVPDTSKDISDTSAPRVWETWKSVAEVILPGGRQPSDWTSFADSPTCPGQNDGADHAIKNLAFAMVGPVLEIFNQVGDTGVPVGSLVAQNRTYVRYEIRFNQKEFEKIRNEKLYLRDELQKRETNQKPIAFDPQSIEIKAAWRELKLPAEQSLLSRYYHVEALAHDPETNGCQKKTFGLIGFHIAQRTVLRNQWIWSTFEHVDTLSVASNAPFGTFPILKSGEQPTNPDGGVTPQQPPKNDPDPTIVKLLPEGAIPAETTETNKKWRNDFKIRDTVWSNYELVKTQWPTKKQAPTIINDPRPEAMGVPFPENHVANITLETYSKLQESSCITCHASSSFHSDFVWFLSLRATESGRPMIERLKKAMKQAGVDK